MTKMFSTECAELVNLIDWLIDWCFYYAFFYSLHKIFLFQITE